MQTPSLKIFLALTLLFFFTQPSLGKTKSRKPVVNSGPALTQLFEAYWIYRMAEFPEEATFNGVAGHNREWTNWSPEALEHRSRGWRDKLKELAAFPRTKLSEADRIDADLLERDLKEMIEGEKFGGKYLQINQLEGPQQTVPDVLALMPTATENDFEDIIVRLHKVPDLVNQTIALLKEGLAKGITPPKITLRDVPAQVEAVTKETIEENPLLVAFRHLPTSLDSALQARLKEKALGVVTVEVAPAFRALKDYLEDTYIPGSRESTAWAALPNGKEWYAYRARSATTTSLTPHEIHDIGMSEVKRIKKEMDEIVRSVGYKEDFKAFTTFLRTDPHFFFATAEDLLRGYRDVAKRIDPGLVKLFGKLPRLTYGVSAVPAYSEKSQTTAYYEPGSPEGARPGYFFANTYNLKARPSWEMEALTLHEAVPGHHLQIALSQEREGAPQFRKYGMYTAFVEGWGLYAESLGQKLGLYQDPYSHFGQLTYEMWRAIRLVVDTGMHELGWSRDQAIQFFKDNTGKTDHDITVEVDRYLVWGGQALAYKIGQMKFLSLREEAAKTLGAKFDIREFHDLALGNGALPLEILEKQVRAWIAKKSSH